jgi:phage FluMu protein Com
VSERCKIKYHGYDDEGYERRERLEGIVDCPRCGKAVELWSATETWTYAHEHCEYGCAMGVCCNLLMVDGFDGLETFKLKAKK